MGVLHSAWLHAVHLLAAIGHVLNVHVLPYWVEQQALPFIILALTFSFVFDYAGRAISALARGCQRISQVFGAASWRLRYIKVLPYIVKRHIRSCLKRHGY